MKRYIVTKQQRDKLYYRALNFGEDLMESNCADIIGNYFRSNETRQAIGREQLAEIIMEMMERCGFCSELEYAMNAAGYLK